MMPGRGTTTEQGNISGCPGLGVTWGQGSEGSDRILGADTAVAHMGHHESFQLHNAQHQGLASRKDRLLLTTMEQ